MHLIGPTGRFDQCHIAVTLFCLITDIVKCCNLILLWIHVEVAGYESDWQMELSSAGSDLNSEKKMEDQWEIL